MFIAIIGLILFVIVFRRLGELETKVKNLSQGIKVEEHKVDNKVVEPTIEPTVVLFPNTPLVTQTSDIKEEVKINTTQLDDSSGGTEFAVGSKVLTGIGVLALILGVSFFLRYAFENNLISESMRVVLGGVFGVVLIGVGHYLRNKFTQYGNTLIGAGLGVLYLSAYSAYSFYGLIDALPAFILLCLITAGGIAMSLRYNSKPLVSYAFLGAYVIPFLMPISESVHILFVYLIILNIGILLIARHKIWPEFTLTSLGFASLIFLRWIYGPYTESLFMETFGYLTLMFLIYFITSLLNFVYRDRDYKGIDGILLYGIPVVYFFLTLTILDSKDEISLLALIVGIFYLVFSLVIRTVMGEVGELKKFSNALLCIASPFIALATVLHFEGSTVTVVWAVEAMVMVLVGYILSTPSNRIMGLTLLVITFFKMIFTDLVLKIPSEVIFNTRSATILFVLVSFGIVWRIYNSYIKDSADEVQFGKLITALGVFVIPFIWITLELNTFITSSELYIPMTWMILCAVMFSVGTIAKDKVLRYLSYVVLGFSVLSALVTSGSLDSSTIPVFNIKVGTALVFALISVYIVWAYKVQREVFSEDEIKIAVPLQLIANGMILWVFSMEILSYFNNQMRSMTNSESMRVIENTKRVVLSGFWLAYALLGLGVGIFKKSIHIRYASIILFAITIFKIFLYDTANLSDIYRFISFISLGVILLIAGYSYYRFKDRIGELVGRSENK